MTTELSQSLLVVANHCDRVVSEGPKYSVSGEVLQLQEDFRRAADYLREQVEIGEPPQAWSKNDIKAIRLASRLAELAHLNGNQQDMIDAVLRDVHPSTPVQDGCGDTYGERILEIAAANQIE